MSSVEVEICGVKVNFPFQPYDVQIEYMKSVLTCLNERRHGVLESPTGTGKTLSLLCSSLAWLQNEKIRKRNNANTGCVQPGAEAHEGPGWTMSSPKIIYASRTHSQLKQVVEQFKKTAYRHLFHSTIMGSRDQMCVNMGVQKESSLAAKNVLCSALVKKRSCRFYNNVKNSSSLADFDPIRETEKALENMRLSRIDTSSCCPYYAGREWVPRSDLIFMPYNYLVDQQTQKSFKFSLSGCIIIIDEGHNIPKVCEEAASVSISSVDIACCLVNVTEEMQNYFEEAMMGSDEKDYSSEDLVVIHQLLTKMEDIVNEFNLKSGGNVFPGSYMFKILGDANLNSENYVEISTLLQQIGDAILTKAGTSSNVKGLPLKKLGDSIFLIFSSCNDAGGMDAIDKSFKVYVEEEIPNGRWNKGNKRIKRISYWCFNPSFTLKQLIRYDVRSIILTSGTLSPLEATVKELSLKNPVTLENGHIINSNQVFVTTISKGPTNVELRCTYENRGNDNYWRELGMAIENLARQIPDGLLVFFPSYSAMSKAQEFWRTTGLLSRLGAIKTVLSEPNNKNEMQAVLTEYTAEIEEKKGAVLFAVCRGKVSEGLDFSGKFARGVIITGIPFAPIFDPKVKLKKEFININRDLFQGLTGDSWYQMDAMRAVNQAMGRVIRHIDDYGAIILCDARFARSSNNALPKWLKSRHFESPSFGRAIVNVRNFFQQAKLLPEMKPEVKYMDDSAVAGPSGVNSELKHIASTPQTSSENEACYLTNEPLSALVRKAEELFQMQCMVNPAILETEIKADALLNVQPAKRRKLRISHPSWKVDEEAGAPPVRDELTNFLFDVKWALEPESYADFAFILRKYRLTKDFEETISKLEMLLIEGEHKFVDIFQRCIILFTEAHQRKFEEYLKSKSMNLQM